MRRFIITILLFITAHSMFAQNRKFEDFTKMMEIYEAEDSVLRLNRDTIIDLNKYDLKWVHLTGSYGGSPYNGGLAIRIDSSNLRDYYMDQIVLGDSLTVNRPYNRLESPTIKIIGDRYIVYYSWYPEPAPTNNPHYVEVVHYYEIKEN